MFGGGTSTSAGSGLGAWEVAPDLECILGEALFGTIWCRAALSLAQRDWYQGCPIDPARGEQIDERLALPRGG